GEEGAKKLLKELGEQMLKHGDDVFLVARKYGLSQTLRILKEVPEETGKKAIKAMLNRGDELVPLVKKFGKEILEVEAKHPGLGKQVAEELGEGDLKVVKNLDTNQVITVLRRKDILDNLTEKGKRVLCQKMQDRGVLGKI
ncbi:MAG: hypothetical protein ACP5KS_02440, partial [Candidatus Hydrogenedens sp.]